RPTRAEFLAANRYRHVTVYNVDFGNESENAAFRRGIRGVENKYNYYRNVCTRPLVEGLNHVNYMRKQAGKTPLIPVPSTIPPFEPKMAPTDFDDPQWWKNYVTNKIDLPKDRCKNQFQQQLVSDGSEACASCGDDKDCISGECVAGC